MKQSVFQTLLWISLFLIPVLLLLIISSANGFTLQQVVGKNFSSRPTTNLVALFTFEETEGWITSDTGPSPKENLDLNSSPVSWLYDSPDDRSTGVKISNDPSWTIRSSNMNSPIAQVINGTNSFSIEMWIDPQEFGDDFYSVPLMAMSKNMYCTTGGFSTNLKTLGDSGVTYANVKNKKDDQSKSLCGSGFVSTANWNLHSGIQHHVMTFENGTFTIYRINNVEAEERPTKACSGSLFLDEDAILSFGRFLDDLGTVPFVGKVYLLALYSPKFPSGDIPDLLNAGLPNQPPSAFSSEITTPEDTPIVFQLNASDPEGTALLFNITSVPEFGHLEDANSSHLISAFDVISNANIRYVPRQYFHGSVSFEFFAIEATGDKKKRSRTATVSIEVTSVPNAPITFNQSIWIADSDVETEMNVTGFHPDEEYGMEIKVGKLEFIRWESSNTNTNAAGKLFQMDGSVIEMSSLPTNITDGPPSFQFKMSPGWIQRGGFDVALIGVRLCDNVTCSLDPGIIRVNVSNSLNAESGEVLIEEDTPTNITLNVTDKFAGRPFSRKCWNFTVPTSSSPSSGTFSPSPSECPICTNESQLQILYSPARDAEGDDKDRINFEMLIEDADENGTMVAISTPGVVVINLDPVPEPPEFLPLKFSIPDFEPVILNITLSHIDQADSHKNLTLRVFNLTSGVGTLRRLEDGKEFPEFSNTSGTLVEFVPRFLENKTEEMAVFFVQITVDQGEGPNSESNVGSVTVNISRSLKAISQSGLNGTEDVEMEIELGVEDLGTWSFNERGILVEYVFNISKAPAPSSGTVILNSTHTQQARIVPAADFWGPIEFEYCVERWNVTEEGKWKRIGVSLPASISINIEGVHDAPHIDLSEIPNNLTCNKDEYVQVRLKVVDADVGWPLIVVLTTDKGLVNVSLPENRTANFSTGSAGSGATTLKFEAPIEVVNQMLHEIGISFRGVEIGNASLTITVMDVVDSQAQQRFTVVGASGGDGFSDSKTISIQVKGAPQTSSSRHAADDNALPLILGITIPTVLFFTLLVLILIVIIVIILIVSLILIRKAKTDALKETIELPPDFEKVAFGAIPPLSSKDRKTANTLLKPLESLVVQEGFYLAQAALQNNASGVSTDDLIRQFVFIAEHYGMNPRLISTFVASETKQCLGKETLFRSNSSASKMMKSYAMIVGLQYLYDTIAQPMKQIVAMTTRLEIDPRKMTEEDDVNENTWEMLATAQRVFKAILRSLEACPIQIRFVCHEIDVAVEEKFGAGNRAIAVGGFFFLRFFCPAVTTPETYGLIKAEDVTDESRARFVAVSKMIMNLAAGVEFGKKETHLVALNPFIQENAKPLAQFYDSIVSLPEGLSADSLPKVKLPNDVRELKLIDLYKVVNASKTQIFKWLDTQHAAATQRQDNTAMHQIDETRIKLKAFLDSHPDGIAFDSDTRELNTVV